MLLLVVLYVGSSRHSPCDADSDGRLARPPPPTSSTVYLRLHSPVSTPGSQQGLAASVLLLVITIVLVVILLTAA